MQLSQFYAIAMLLVTLSNMATVICLRLHYHNSHKLSELPSCVSVHFLSSRFKKKLAIALHSLLALSAACTLHDCSGCGSTSSPA